MTSRMIVGWMMVVATVLSTAVRADEPPITVRVLALEADGNPLVDLGLICTEAGGRFLGRAYTDARGQCGLEFPRPTNERVYIEPAAVARSTAPPADVLSIITHFRSILETQSFPSCVAIPLHEEETEYEVVVQAKPAVKVFVCQPDVSDHARRMPFVSSFSSTIVAVPTDVNNGCYEIRGVARGDPCMLAVWAHGFESSGFASLIPIEAVVKP